MAVTTSPSFRHWALLACALATLAVASAEGPPRRGVQEGDGGAASPAVRSHTLVPSDWRSRTPYAQRFSVARATPGDRRHVIDLAALRFETDTLRGTDADGVRTFAPPDLSSFRPGLVREAFDRGLPDFLIVQAPGPEELVELRTWLEEANVPIAGYIPADAYLVRLEPRLMGALRGHLKVFWAGLYQPAFRVEPRLDYAIAQDDRAQVTLRANFDLADYGDEQELLADLRKASLAVLSIDRTELFWTVKLEGAAGEVDALAALPGCVWVERFVDFELHNSMARTSVNVPTGRGASSGPIMDVEDVWARGIRGEGQIASAADTGLSTGNLATLHQDFGDQADPVNNPMRVIKGYALGRATWDDPNPGGGHGTHTSGSILGNGFLSGATPSTNTFPTSSYAGTAPKARYVFQSVMDSDGYLSGIPLDLTALFRQTYNDGARVHSNSWGSPVAGQYTGDSVLLDFFAWTHRDMVITFSAGNSGTDAGTANGVIDTDSIGAPGTAKNCITVGASENYRPDFVYEWPEGDCVAEGGTPAEQQAWGWFNSAAYPTAPIRNDFMANNANGMGAFSSRGPTDDGRIKPEVVAPGIAIISTRTNQSQEYEQWGICDVPSSPTDLRPHYLTMGGTSMSNPLTAGAAVLVRQYFVDGWHPNHSMTANTSALGLQGFNPSSALVKAVLINGAWDMTPGQYGTGTTREIPPGWDTGRDLPNNAEGYGRVDLEHSLFPGSGWNDNPARRLLVHDVTPGLVTGGSDAYTFDVSGDANPLIVTLVWTDPPALSGAGSKLVNNLDLEVKSPSAAQYLPNRRNTQGTSTDTVNTVEQVIVTSPASGAWSIRVLGTSVPGFAGATTQPYALVISGLACHMDPPTGVTAAAVSGNRVDVSWIAVPGAAEYRVFRGTSPGGPYGSSIGTTYAPSITYPDTSAVPGVTYYYVVRSYGSGASACESSDSVEVSQTICAMPPSFSGLASVTASCALTLSWSQASSQCSDGRPITYNVYRSTASSFTPDASNRIASGLTTTTYSDSSGIATGATYHYLVRAVDATTGAEDANAAYGSGSVSAGTVTILSEGFALGNPPSGWALVDGGDGTQRWTTTNPGGLSTPSGWTAPFESINSRIDSSYATQEDHLLTPSLDCTGAASVVLSYRHSFTAGNANWMPSTAFVDVSPDGGGSWTNRATYPSSASGSVSVDVSALAASSSSVRVRFRYSGIRYLNNARNWLVDDVTVTRTCPGSGSSNPNRHLFLTARASSGTVKLEWVNPAGTVTGSTARYRTDTFPSGPSDGAAACTSNGSADQHDTCAASGLTNGVPLNFSTFAINGSLYSGARTTQSRPFDTSGKVKWAFSTGASSLTPPGVWPGAVGVGQVMAVSNDRTLYAMSPTAGPTGGDWPAGWTPLAMNGPSQDRPGMVPFTVDGASRVIYLSSQDGKVYCVDAATGAQLWASSNTGDMLQGSPSAVFTAYGGAANLLFAGTRNAGADNKLYCMSPTTGVVYAGAEGTFDNGGGGDGIGIIAAQPLVDYGNSRVYFTSRARTDGSAQTVWCVTFGAGGLTGALAGFAPPPVGDVDSTPLLFRPASETYLPKRLYVGTNASRLYALNPATGAALWSISGSPYLDLADGPVKGSIDRQPGSSRLYLATTNKVWCIDDNGGTASQVWSVSLGAGVTPSTPMFLPGANRLLVGASNGRLYQLDTIQSPPPTTTYVTLGTGNAAVGSPAFDVINNVIYVGSEAGVVYAVEWPLS
jgi:outer membrane protein assembly factor BamB